MATSKRALKKGEEGEQIIATLLESDSSFHRLINNLVLLGDNQVSHQIDHIFSDILPPLKEVGASCAIIPTDQA